MAALKKSLAQEATPIGSGHAAASAATGAAIATMTGQSLRKSKESSKCEALGFWSGRRPSLSASA
jgi:hypothetical protein